MRRQKSQPLHTTIRFKGWGNYPNPNEYTTKDIHSYFEGEFVKPNASRAAVAAEVGPKFQVLRLLDRRSNAVVAYGELGAGWSTV